MARNCLICSDPAKLRIAAEMIAAGATYRVISERVQVGRMVVYRHAKNHVVAPAKAAANALAAVAAAANKGADVRAERERAMALAEQGDPTAFIALAGIVDDLKKVHERLERTADGAEQDKQRLAVASLSSQQLRAAEVRAKIGGVGGYAPQRQGTVESPMFSITMILGDRTERIDMTAADHAPGKTIDMRPDQPSGFTTVVDLPDLIAQAEDDQQGDASEGGA